VLPLGIYAWFGFKMPLGKRLELIKQAGFDATCLWLDRDEEMFRNGRADDMPKLVRDNGLILDNVHAPYRNIDRLWCKSHELRKVIREELGAALAFCVKHQIPIMVMHLTGDDPPASRPESGLQLIRDLVHQAEDSGVTIALENLDDFTYEYLDFVFSNIQSPNLAFCYDSSHDFTAGELRGTALGRWGHLLAATHLSDNYGINDDHLLPGTGTIDWHAVEKNFPRSSFRGALMLELQGPGPDKDFTPGEFLRAGHRWLQLFANAVVG
jgi:sugar phosphate isomerase/epimerase